MQSDQVIDSAPGKEFLDGIANGSIDALKRFYEVRKAWSRGSPLIHDHFVTYDFVDDLCFDPRQTGSFVPTMAEIALQETPAFFHCALTLLSNLIPDDRILPRPEGFGQQLLSLKKRVEQFSFIPNMTTTWETLMTRARCLKPVLARWRGGVWRRDHSPDERARSCITFKCGT